MQLLVSARDVDEARLAISANVDIVDLKEPLAGSLGPVPVSVAKAVVRLPQPVGRQVHLSMALGELNENGVCESVSLPSSAFEYETEPKKDSFKIGSFDFAKIGLSGCRGRNWQAEWQQWAKRVKDAAPTINCVVVAYADHGACSAPDVDSVIDFAIRVKSRYVLLDTSGKQQGTIFDYYSAEQLRRFRMVLNQQNIKFVLAGSLNLDAWEAIVEIDPDVVAVRGAVCHESSRSNSICRQRLLEWKMKTKKTKSA